MKSVVKTNATMAEFFYQRRMAMLKLFLKIVKVEDIKEAPIIDPFSFRIFANQKAKKGYGRVRYAIHVKNQYQIRVTNPTATEWKFIVEKVSKNESND